MVNPKNMDIVTKTEITVLLIIKFFIRMFVMFIFVIPTFQYHWYDIDEVRQFVGDENKKFDQLTSIRLHAVGIYNRMAINGRIVDENNDDIIDDEEFEKIKEEVMMLKEDVENSVKDRFHKFSDKDISIHISGEGIFIKIENDVNANPPYALKFTQFSVKGEDISESINDEMNAD